MKNFVILLVFVVLVGLAVYLFTSGGPGVPGGAATTTPAGGQSITTPSGVTFSYPGAYGLGVSPAQVLVKSYIPPCAEGFDYCVYRLAEPPGTSQSYAGTNFESAGLSLKSRSDLATKQACLTTLPDGYTNLTPKTSETATYAVSAFAPLGDAAAGHYSAGALYRLYANNTCTELQTRIGESQFANYPAGTITKFTDADRARVAAELQSILSGVTVGGTHVAFPAVSLSTAP